MSSKDEKAQAAAERIKAQALSQAKGLSRAQAERAAAAAARNVNAYGQKEEGPSRWQERKEAKRQMYLMSTEKAVTLGERKDLKAPTSSSGGVTSQCQRCLHGGGGAPRPPGAPPPPPPPPGSLLKASSGGEKVHRAPELVEFYQSLMKRESKREVSPGGGGSGGAAGSNVASARSNMIGEIENRSAFLIAVKADVETQGDFVQSLAAEVRAASFSRIEDLLSFVNWLDEELSFLVDERAVLKHFDWPEGKADALREAAFECQDLMKLEKQVTTFADDPKLSCEAALKKMYSLLEKMEQSVYALLRTRDMAASRYKEFGIPTDWLSDSGLVGKIKLSSVQLARKYMKRVTSELDAMDGPEKEPNREFLLLQGVRFAFRVHQFAGGFDAESMRAFEELRSRVGSQTGPAAE